MSRLLHAAARGARVQREQKLMTGTKTWWQHVPLQWGLDYELRIHPDDAHLQYGPISTALRDVALTGDCEDYEIPYCRFVIEKEDIYSESTEDERSMFLLFLAEALADEGM